MGESWCCSLKSSNEVWTCLRLLGALPVVGPRLVSPAAGALQAGPTPDTWPIIPTDTVGLVLHHALFFSLRSLVTMDTVEEAPLPAEADGWHSRNE